MKKKSFVRTLYKIRRKGSLFAGLNDMPQRKMQVNTYVSASYSAVTQCLQYRMAEKVIGYFVVAAAGNSSQSDYLQWVSADKKPVWKTITAVKA
jgi:hypothetical protein